jgi:uncharacterized membrane protein YidH (DUF202 family)
MELINLILLTLHNLTRWAVLVFAILVIVLSYRGWFSKKKDLNRDKKLSSAYAGVFDLQVLLGAILFFTRGWGTTLINGGAAVMTTPSVRFFTVEHWSIMLIALVFAHIGSSQIKKATDSGKQYLWAAIWFTLSLLLVIAAIPWPGLAAGRPLLRIFGFSL